MPNMSYCRFQNTVLDLKDCLSNIDESDLSKEELAARAYLYVLAQQYINEFETIEDLTNVN